jgi:hypothetical protein
MLRDSQNNMSLQQVYLQWCNAIRNRPLLWGARCGSRPTFVRRSLSVCFGAESGPHEVNHTSSPLPHHHLYRILFWGTLLPAKPSPIGQPDLPDSPPNKGARNLRPLCVRERSNTHTPTLNNINRFAFAFHSLPRVRLKDLRASCPPILHPHIRF